MSRMMDELSEALGQLIAARVVDQTVRKHRGWIAKQLRLPALLSTLDKLSRKGQAHMTTHITPAQRLQPESWRDSQGHLLPSERRARRELLDTMEQPIKDAWLNAGQSDFDLMIDATRHLDREQFIADVCRGRILGSNP